MSNFKLLPLDNEIPLGNNSLNASAMFYQRRKFKEYSVPYIKNEKMIATELLDITDFSKGTDYGRIDPFGNVVSINLDELQVVNFGGTNLLIPKFLQQYITDFSKLHQKSMLQLNTPDTSTALRNTKPQFCTRNHEVEYNENKETDIILFQDFLKRDLLKKGRIRNKKDFFNEAINFILQRVSLSNSITKIGFTSSIYSDVLDSGLGFTYAIGQEAGDDQELYNQYYNDSRFKSLLDVSERTGFLIPLRTPWILLLDLDSQYFRETCQERLGVKDKYEFFRKYYTRSDKGDLLRLVDLMVKLYYPINLNPFVDYNYICPKSNKIIQVRDKLSATFSREDVYKEFGKENLLRTYLRIRIAETKNSMPVEEQEIILKSAFNKARISDDEAVFYINDCLSPYVQRQLTTI